MLPHFLLRIVWRALNINNIYLYKSNFNLYRKNLKWGHTKKRKREDEIKTYNEDIYDSIFKSHEIHKSIFNKSFNELTELWDWDIKRILIVEDSKWLDEKNNTSLIKKQEKEKKRQEKIAKKNENKKKAEEEAEFLQKKYHKTQVRTTVHKIMQEKEKEKTRIRKKLEDEKDDKLENFADLEIHNKLNAPLTDEINASNLSTAVDQLEIEEEDRHPEKRMKAAFKKYKEINFPIIKAEYPSLKYSQLKQKIWDEWQTSPENPIYKAKLQMAKKEYVSRQRELKDV